MKKLIILLSLTLFASINLIGAKEFSPDSIVFVQTKEDSILTEIYVKTLEFEIYAEYWDEDGMFFKTKEFMAACNRLDDLYLAYIIHEWLIERQVSCTDFPKARYNYLLNPLKRIAKKIIKTKDKDYLQNFSCTIRKVKPNHIFIKYIEKRLKKINKKLE